MINRQERENKELALEEKKINIDAMVEAAKIEEGKKQKNETLTAKVVMDLLKLVDKQKFQEGGFVEQARGMQPSSVAQASAEEFKQAADLAIKQPMVEPKGFLEQAMEAQGIDPQQAVRERMAEQEMRKAPIIPVERKDIPDEPDLSEMQKRIQDKEKEVTVSDNQELLNIIKEKNLPRIGEGLLGDPTTEVRLSNMDEFIQEMESNFNPKAKNPKSTAAGLYQFTEASLETAVNRLANTIGEDNLPQWAVEAREHKDARKLSEEEQKVLFYADMFQKSGSDKYLASILKDGNTQAVIDYYKDLHHTDPDEATLKRIGKISKKYNLDSNQIA